MPRLNDKHIAAIRAAAEDNEQSYGYGDVILLCDELQERRKNGENVPTALLGDRLLERFQEGSNVSNRTAAALIEYLQGKPHKREWEIPEEVTNLTLLEELTKRINENEGLPEEQVQALLQALQASGKDINPTLDLAQTSATNLIQELTTCIKQNEPLRDADVLALFHALQRQNYFQTITFVNRQALEKVVLALTCAEHPHVIRELQVTRGLPLAQGEAPNPIDQLIQDIQHASVKPD